MAVPDEEQTKQALERVKMEGCEPGLGEVIWHELDLKDPRGAKSSAERFMEKETRLDILGASYLMVTSRILIFFTHQTIPQSIMQPCSLP